MMTKHNFAKNPTMIVGERVNVVWIFRDGKASDDPWLKAAGKQSLTVTLPRSQLSSCHGKYGMQLI